MPPAAVWKRQLCRSASCVAVQSSTACAVAIDAMVLINQTVWEAQHIAPLTWCWLRG
jgi:hypothetical protein